jgi:ABC-type polysaccharide/polyol phosphate export permease
MSAIAEQRRPREQAVAEVHVYEPHEARLPPLGPYVREVWRRRHFVFELARANLRGQHYNTALGQLWLILNPLFLALVLMALVTVVRGGSRGGEFFAHLVLCLFAFRIVSTSVKQGAKSVTSGGRLILNVVFPRAVLPLQSVMTAFMRFLPTVALYAILHVAVGLPITPQLLWAVPILAFIVVFALGSAMLVAAVQVYFRDMANFLTYFTRIWLYASPVIYYAHEVPDRFKPILMANPLYPMLAALSDAVTQGENPSPEFLAAGLAWAVGGFLLGAFIFLSREREFAVRL